MLGLENQQGRNMLSFLGFDGMMQDVPGGLYTGGMLHHLADW